MQFFKTLKVLTMTLEGDNGSKLWQNVVKIRENNNKTNRVLLEYGEIVLFFSRLLL